MPHLHPADALTWTELGEEHLAALAEPATASLAADGGLPLLTRQPLLRARLLQAQTLGAWHDGKLVAAIGVGTDHAPATGTGPDGTPAGFLNVSENWIDQVGVVPGWRGRRVGAYLVATALRSLSAEGARDAWLCVNDNNPAAGLYRRLGFRDAGRRARYLLHR
jgi:ribosomal protein S18 acetylase RimI-like enzyme